MSKPIKEKIVIAFENEPLLADMDFENLVLKFDRLHCKEREYSQQVAHWKELKDTTGLDIRAAIEAVNADTVTATFDGKEFRTTLVKGEPGSKTDEDKLRENMLKIGKLDADTVSRIFKLSQVPTEAKKPYIRVTTKD